MVEGIRYSVLYIQPVDNTVSSMCNQSQKHIRRHIDRFTGMVYIQEQWGVWSGDTCRGIMSRGSAMSIYTRKSEWDIWEERAIKSGIRTDCATEKNLRYVR